MPSDRDDDSDSAKGRGGGISDIMKKALFAGIGAVFMTEESVRNYVSEAKLPRDIRNYIIQNTSQAKEQFFAYLSKELSQVILRSDLPKVIQRFLADHTIELEAKIRFKPNGAPELTGAARAAPLAAHGAPQAPASAMAPPPPAAALPLPGVQPVAFESQFATMTHMPSSTPLAATGSDGPGGAPGPRSEEPT